jgi:hypothetical protein
MKPIRDARPMGDVLLAAGRAVLGGEAGKGPLPWRASSSISRPRGSPW